MDFRILLEKITPALKYIARRNTLYGFYSAEDLYQEMCLFLWQHYAGGLPLGINQAYVIKACEFHLKNFLRKGRPKASTISLQTLVSSRGQSLEDILEDQRSDFRPHLENKISVDQIKALGLTAKEREVVSCLLCGYTVRQTAAQLGVSHVMVLKHKKNIAKKLRQSGYQR
jgi:RNA polymerase sigma factor (sigma-70 family)